ASGVMPLRPIGLPTPCFCRRIRRSDSPVCLHPGWQRFPLFHGLTPPAHDPCDFCKRCLPIQARMVSGETPANCAIVSWSTLLTMCCSRSHSGSLYAGTPLTMISALLLPYTAMPVSVTASPPTRSSSDCQPCRVRKRCFLVQVIALPSCNSTRKTGWRPEQVTSLTRPIVNRLVLWSRQRSRRSLRRERPYGVLVISKRSLIIHFLVLLCRLSQ